MDASTGLAQACGIPGTHASGWATVVVDICLAQSQRYPKGCLVNANRWMADEQVIRGGIG
jgi:hypothetical protein